MRWKPWLIVCASLLCLACASSSEPVLSATLAIGGGNNKRVLELTGRKFQVTLFQVDPDGTPFTQTRTGNLHREEYQRLLEQFAAIDLTALKDLYTGRDSQAMRTITTLRITHKGVTKSIAIVGPPPADVAPLLSPLLPLLDRIF